MRRFEVVIVYREPTYARWRGIPEKDYRAVFVVDAASEEQARGAALAQFYAMVREESVNWVRRIERIECHVASN